MFYCMEGAVKDNWPISFQLLTKGGCFSVLSLPFLGSCLSHSCHSTVLLLTEDLPPSQDQDGSDIITGSGLGAGTGLLYFFFFPVLFSFFS